VTSQFENHLRAICGLPLGSTRALGHRRGWSTSGADAAIERLLAIDGLAFHDYGKEPRARPKLGHCTVLRSGRGTGTAPGGILKLGRSGVTARFHPCTLIP